MTAELDAERRARFGTEGYVAVRNLVEPAEVAALRLVVDRLLGGTDCGGRRSDLGGFRARVRPDTENVIQIMLPSDFAPELLHSDYYRRAEAVARGLQGEDMALDFDMIISKAPGSRTEVPWHQDVAYWLPDMPDRRAASCWLALDDATVENGCMWFVPGSQLRPMRPHRWAGPKSHALVTDVAPGEGVPVPLGAGSATFHQGGTLHYTGGNTTGAARRALIASFRPRAMIDWERRRGYDHRTEADR